MTVVLEGGLVLEDVFVEGFERIIKITDAKSGLKALICLHNGSMGPCLGGTRIYPYASYQAGLTDVMRLAKGMTYKSAIAGTGFGGGKSVIFADPKKDKTEALLLAFGDAVNRLKGQYICAEDVGSTPDDMSVVRRATPYVVGLPHEKSSGNPSPFTAWGTYRGIQSVLKKMYDNSSVHNRTIAIQGLGSVGLAVAKQLFWEGANLILTDIDMEKARKIAEQLGAQMCQPEEIFSVECDVFSPCALGGVINAESILKMRCAAIAGCANNQLWRDQDAELLVKKNILYAPDFVINAGGLINVVNELEAKGYNPTKARNEIHQLFDQLMLIYDIAEQNRFSTHQAAVALGDYRLKYQVGKRQTPIHLHHAGISY